MNEHSTEVRDFLMQSEVDKRCYKQRIQRFFSICPDYPERESASKAMVINVASEGKGQDETSRLNSLPRTHWRRYATNIGHEQAPTNISDEAKCHSEELMSIL